MHKNCKSFSLSVSKHFENSSTICHNLAFSFIDPGLTRFDHYMLFQQFQSQISILSFLLKTFLKFSTLSLLLKIYLKLNQSDSAILGHMITSTLERHTIIWIWTNQFSQWRYALELKFDRNKAISRNLYFAMLLMKWNAHIPSQFVPLTIYERPIVNRSRIFFFKATKIKLQSNIWQGDRECILWPTSYMQLDFIRNAIKFQPF